MQGLHRAVQPNVAVSQEGQLALDGGGVPRPAAGGVDRDHAARRLAQPQPGQVAASMDRQHTGRDQVAAKAGVAQRDRTAGRDLEQRALTGPGQRRRRRDDVPRLDLRHKTRTRAQAGRRHQRASFHRQPAVVGGAEELRIGGQRHQAARLELQRLVARQHDRAFARAHRACRQAVQRFKSNGLADTGGPNPGVVDLDVIAGLGHHRARQRDTAAEEQIAAGGDHHLGVVEVGGVATAGQHTGQVHVAATDHQLRAGVDHAGRLGQLHVARG